MLAVVDMAEIYSKTFWNLCGDLDSSLDPAGPDQLYDIAAAYLHRGQRLLDVGCRDARHLIELVRRYDATGIGLDPVPWHVQRAQTAVAEAGLAAQITIHLGVAEDLDEPSASIDTIWCRDVIEVLPDLPAALAQMRRVLRPSGHLIAYTNVLHGPIDPVETATIHEPLGNVVANLVETDLEAAFDTAGFAISAKHVIGTEWREFLEEHDQAVSRDLLRLARLRRNPDRIIQRYGHDAYRTAEASLQWGLHQILGRFVPLIYVLDATTPRCARSACGDDRGPRDRRLTLCPKRNTRFGYAEGKLHALVVEDDSGSEMQEEISDTERAVHGAVTLPELRSFLHAWSQIQLGSAIADIRFRAGRIDAVWGLELQDGRAAVIKAHRTPIDIDAASAAVDAQRALVAAGFPCPIPLAGPDVVDGRVLTAESLIVGGRPDGRRPATRRLLADGLARHIDILRGRSDLVGRAGAGPSWCRYQDGPWPLPHDTLVDFESTVPRVRMARQLRAASRCTDPRQPSGRRDRRRPRRLVRREHGCRRRCTGRSIRLAARRRQRGGHRRLRSIVLCRQRYGWWWVVQSGGDRRLPPGLRGHPRIPAVKERATSSSRCGSLDPCVQRSVADCPDHPRPLRLRHYRHGRGAPAALPVAVVALASTEKPFSGLRRRVPIWRAIFG